MVQVRNLQFRDGSYAKALLLALATTGEYDYKQLPLLHDHFVPRSGYEKRIIVRALDTMKRHADTSKEKKSRTQVYDENDHRHYRTPYVSILGENKKENKRIVLTKRGRVALAQFFPEHYEYFNIQTHDGTFVNTNSIQTRRAMRLAELMQWVIQSPLDIKYLHTQKPDIKDKTPYKIGEDEYLFYNSREIKEAVGGEHLKIDFTRFFGIVVSKDKAVVLFHAGKRLFTWKTQGEQKTQSIIKRLLWNKFGIEAMAPSVRESLPDALIFGRDYTNSQVRYLINSKSKRKTSMEHLKDMDYEFFSVGNVYRNTYFVPTEEPLLGHISLTLLMKPKLTGRMNNLLANSHPIFKGRWVEKLPAGLIGDFYQPEERKIGYNLIDGSLSKLKIARKLAYSRPQESYVFFATKSQKVMIEKMFEEFPSITYEVQVLDEWALWEKALSKWAGFVKES